MEDKHGHLNKQLCHKVQTAQRATDRKMLNIKLKDRVPTTELRKKDPGDRCGRTHTKTYMEVYKTHCQRKRRHMDKKMHKVGTKVGNKRQGQTGSKMD
ncbi:hypothetical protein PoB_004134700 [Plakobranchus ocellatus]|uniref:40S ribosomal protein S24 n=1 Tax=Plakobranchus ocellatus TaxID=259542 RepID=A0AAV4B5Q8_9GAST|nr:hypothetical protein PoB_004134700 [Plakobranchus ocellatus]